MGINSALTQTGDNDNLRLLRWSSSGYKPTSQTSAVEKLTDAIKEQVNDGAPGENKRDEDVQEMKQESKAQSIQVTDLEQYVVSRMKNGGMHCDLRRPHSRFCYTESHCTVA